MRISSLLSRPVLCIFVLAASFRGFSQPNPLSFNTAVNSTNNGTLPPGTDDLSWMVAMTSSAGTYVNAKCVGNVAGWMNSPFPTAEWITYPHNCSASFAEHNCLGNVDEFYKLTINLPANTCNGSVSTPSAYCLSMSFFADNWVHEIFLNGNSVYLNPNPNAYGAYGFTPSGGATVTICNFWQPGSNDLIVHVKSGAPTFPGWTGFLGFVNTSSTTSQPYSISLTHTNVSCFGQANGAASATVTGGSGPVSYSWQPTGGNSPVAASLTAGVYTLTTNEGNCTVTNTIQITQPPAATMGVQTPLAKCKGTKLTFTATGAQTYSWMPGSLGGATVAVTPTANTVYTVNAVNAAGCPASKVFTQQVLPCTSVDAITGIGSFEFYPNPANDRLMVSGLANDDVIQILTVDGRLCYSGNSVSQIDLSGFPAGMFIIRAITANGPSRARLVIKRE
jgi:hypothetical protein